ncbi:hypothetical protein BXO88_10790 [Oribacterium sp. C9]|uniref:ParB/RepB/Spo0J family partition protein n=1 Tax=Oribacterium sp. C9 TaxID=1943579 RepID=UPI00098FB7CD|nr:ParB N-terminal domain-containing protein [Oribacterium sp. C9]OON85738.1 hypothetical protein BXO88_10790 [Oribacterium sp. C9]
MSKVDYTALQMGAATNIEKMKLSKEKMQHQVAAVQSIVSDSKRVDIPYNQLVRYTENRENDDENIDDLVQSIKTIGFQSTILVRKIPHEVKYEILSGHRRWRAFGKILEENPNFEDGKMPAIVLPDNTSDKTAKMANILLNLETVGLTPKQRRQSVVELTQLFEENGKLPVDKANYIAQKLNTNALTVYRYRKFSNKLIPELGELLDNEFITQNQCEEFSRLTESNQVLVYQTLIEQIDNKVSKPSIDPDKLNEMIENDKQIQKIDNNRDKQIKSIESNITKNQERLDDPNYTGMSSDILVRKIKELEAQRDTLLEEKVKSQKRESEAVRRLKQSKKTINDAAKATSSNAEITDEERAVALAYSDKLNKLNLAMNNMSNLIYRDKITLSQDQISKLKEVMGDMNRLIEYCQGHTK